VYHRVWDVLLELQRYRDGRERTVFGMIAGRGRPREDRSWARDVAWRDVDDTLWPDDIDGPRWLGIDDLDPDGDLPLGDSKTTKEEGLAKRVADEDVQLNEVDAAGRTVPADQTYIVQLHRKDGEWLDVGAVTVPGRTRRTEVLTRAGALEPVVEEL
jgi:hypothetical protein